MKWVFLMGHVVVYADTSIMSLEKAGLTYMFSLCLILFFTSLSLLFLNIASQRGIRYFAGRCELLDKIKNKACKISDKIISKWGYCGLIILALSPIPFAKEAGIVSGHFFGLEYTLLVILIFNAIRLSGIVMLYSIS